MTNNIRNALKVFADLGVGSGPDHETETYQIERGAIRKARAVLVSELAAPTIKPLVWRDHRPDSFPEPAWSAQTPFGFYNIEEVSASDSPAYVVRLHAHHFIADKYSLEEAKGAAQADYERRIRSALQDSPCCRGLAPITECQCEQERLTALNQKLTEDLTALALDWQGRAEKLSVALAAEQAINKDLKIELDEVLVAFADQKVISNYSREQAIKALATLKLARPYVARIASRTSGPDVRDHLSKIDAIIGKQD